MSNNIWKIKDIGEQRDCLIVGGGMSVDSLSFSDVPEDVIIIAINDASIALNDKGVRVDYTVYNDSSFAQRVSVSDIAKYSTVICTNEDWACTGVSYKCKAPFFKDIGMLPIDGDASTGAKAIVIAKKVMNFNRVFLIGFDCKLKPNNEGVLQSHFHGDDKLGEQIRSHVKDLSGRFISEFRFIAKHIHNVYNLCEDNAIECFPYAEKIA